MIRIIEIGVAADLRKTELHLLYSRPHMTKSRYSQHSYLEDGELTLKYQASKYNKTYTSMGNGYIIVTNKIK